MIDGLQIIEHIRTMQNIVLQVASNGARSVLRLTDPRHRTADEIGVEIQLLLDLRELTDHSIVPLPFESGLFVETVDYDSGRYHAVQFPYIDGGCVDEASPDSPARLGEVLAGLHTAMATLPGRYALPVMSEVSDPARLIHGDFASGNVLLRGTTCVIIDFESARYSSYEYELANSIYMVLFSHRDRLPEFADLRYGQGLLAGYTQHRSVDIAAVRSGIDVRVGKLAGWLRTPSTAPLVIANSSAEWKRELARFVDDYETGRFEPALQF